MIIANIVPVLSGGIIIGSDIMKALQVTIPYNDDNTAMLTVDGQSITFQYSNLAHEPIPKPFIRTMNVTKSSSRTSPSHGKKVDKTLTVHVELGKTSLNFRSRS